MHSTKKLTREEFLFQAKQVHGEKYDYSKVEYINNVTKVCIICPIHGEFWQTPKQHKKGRGCPECGKKCVRGRAANTNIRKKTIVNCSKEKNKKLKVPRNIKDIESFIKISRNVHGDKYDYSKVKYTNNGTKVCIICPDHGEFFQTPYLHMTGCGCNKCGRMVTSSKQKYSREMILERLKELYGNKYLFINTDEINSKGKVTFICPIHGVITTKVQKMLKGNGCWKCLRQKTAKKLSLGKDKFVEKSNLVHHNAYTYENVEYVNNATKVVITCKKHGGFLCTPANHLKGRGCPICKAESNVYENRFYNFLLTIFNEEEIIRQFRAEWLSNGKSLDFYIPKYNIGIEHQGSQHFKLIPFFYNTNDEFELRKKLDIEKYKECIKNNVNLLYFTYELPKVENYFEIVYTDEDKIKKRIIELINDTKNE